MNKIQTIQVLEKHMKLLRENTLFNSNEGCVLTKALKESIKALKVSMLTIDERKDRLRGIMPQ